MRPRGRCQAIDSYRNHPSPDEQNEYLLGVFGHLFDQILSQDLAPGALVAAVQRGVGEGRIIAWSPLAEIQAALEMADAAGALEPAQSRVEVGINNFGASKFDIFTTRETEFSHEMVGCAVMGWVEISLSESAPPSLRPLLSYGAQTNRWSVNFYLPPGSHLQRLLDNASETNGGSGTWEERPFASVFVEAPLGGTATAGVEWLAPIPSRAASPWPAGHRESASRGIRLRSAPGRRLWVRVVAADPLQEAETCRFRQPSRDWSGSMLVFVDEAAAPER